MPTRTTAPAEAAPAAPTGTPDERLAALLEQSNLVARYLEAHGRWVEEHHRGNSASTVVRRLTFCACPVCADARAALGLVEEAS